MNVILLLILACCKVLTMVQYLSINMYSDVPTPLIDPSVYSESNTHCLNNSGFIDSFIIRECNFAGLGSSKRLFSLVF